MLPRFAIKTHGKLEAVIDAMANSNGTVDFSPLGFACYPVSRLEAIHSTCIETTETGTIAAGAAAVCARRGGGGSRSMWIGDHPFIQLIIDHSNNVLFVSLVYAP
jgi:serine protease inhibitor